MTFIEALKYLTNHARFSRSETGVSETTLEDASVVVDQFVKYLPTGFTNDNYPNMQKIKSHTHFFDDKEKMKDFEKLSKKEFLQSYSYLNETEYNLTRIRYREEIGYGK